ncbi:ly6/PLAUR domain-containing protein 2-like [Eleutherodactylus coqui]|uniref:ly6/PLAUR domain-containing protein 2-like n=1 Tax=Eleutherodactylus coqui TaxID=57060 RepID=UPI0034623744
MAGYTSLLLVIALCAATGDLKFTIRARLCNALQYFSSPSNSHMLTLHFFRTLIAKMCASSCSLSSDTNGIASVSCCSTDLCNHSGSASIRSSCAAISLALGSVLIILKSSVL